MKVGVSAERGQFGTRDLPPSMRGDSWSGEQHLIKRAPRWTILRSNFLPSQRAQEIQMSLGMGALTGLGTESAGFVSREDVAAASILIGQRHAGAIYHATGPERATSAEKAFIVSKNRQADRLCRDYTGAARGWPRADEIAE
jgi:NAD(P)H dehydrogenase (quinone)